MQRPEESDEHNGRPAVLADLLRRTGSRETTSVGRALDVEGALVDHFYDHLKCSNDQTHGGGGVGHGDHHVYLAPWFK